LAKPGATGVPISGRSGDFEPSVVKNIVLVGFMGTGKSVVGRALAQRLRRPFIDVDELIEREAGRPIRSIFAEEGEAAFRRVEGAAIQRVSQREGQIVATGGGALLDEGNVAALKRHGRLVWLKADPDIILQRIGDAESRPLLNVADPKARLAELLALRQATYAKADAAVETSGRSIEQVVEEVLRLMPVDEGR